MTSQFKRTTITAALPYANGPKHIGHLAGAYLPADVYARFLRLQKKDVVFVCGSDEHGTAIANQAMKENTTPRAIIDKYHHLNEASFKKLGISFDIYHRTSDPLHHKTATEFFTKLQEKGVFKEETTEQYFDPEKGVFLADRYIVGTCPKCGYENAYGDQCERCGSSLSPEELINPHSVLSGKTPEKKSTKHWYLPLDQYEDWLREWILEGHKNDWKANVYGQCKSWIEAGLHPRAVTRDLDWGVPVPLPEAEGKVLYVWFDAPIGYISATRAWAEKNGKNWEDYWKKEDTRLLHFIGKDNIVFHCIIFPVMLHAEGSYILPENVPANEFMNLEGDKMSTSRGWSIEMHEYLEDFPDKPDVLRYYLISNAPETKDSEFTWKDFQAKNDNELVAIFGNFVNRTFVLMQKYYEGILPDFKEEKGPTEIQLENELNRIPAAIQQSMDQFRFREALAEAMNLARAGNKYLADNEPWKLIKTNPQKVAQIMNYSVQICANLALVFEPFLPFISEKLYKMLNISTLSYSDAGRTNIVPIGHQLGNPEFLFEKIEDSVVEAQLKKLHDKKAGLAVKPSAEAQHGETTYDDFSKMDIRVVTILEAEKVPKTDKLMKLKVDTGFDQRTIVSGIAQYYSPEQLVGQQVSMLVNLAPRSIKGIESRGMILMAADHDGKLSLVQPDKGVSNGSIIK
jgi:methionyl-tRNA synthetase